MEEPANRVRAGLGQTESTKSGRVIGLMPSLRPPLPPDKGDAIAGRCPSNVAECGPPGASMSTALMNWRCTLAPRAEPGKWQLDGLGPADANGSAPGPAIPLYAASPSGSTGACGACSAAP